MGLLFAQKDGSRRVWKFGFPRDNWLTGVSRQESDVGIALPIRVHRAREVSDPISIACGPNNIRAEYTVGPASFGIQDPGVEFDSNRNLHFSTYGPRWNTCVIIALVMLAFERSRPPPVWPNRGSTRVAAENAPFGTTSVIRTVGVFSSESLAWAVDAELYLSGVTKFFPVVFRRVLNPSRRWRPLQPRCRNGRQSRSLRLPPHQTESLQRVPRCPH